jgi:pimeloyl-ACP methyl ester carboxylesterase
MIAEAQPTGLWLVGSNTGGSLAMCVAADDPRIRGCALLGPRADFDDWAAQPRKFLDHCREVGSVRTPRFPSDFDEWTRDYVDFGRCRQPNVSHPAHCCFCMAMMTRVFRPAIRGSWRNPMARPRCA